LKVLFDNNAFAYLAQQLKYVNTLNKLKKLVKNERLEVVGSVTLLQELSGLADSNSSLYLQTLLEYEKITNGKILQLSNELLEKEGKELRPLFYKQSLMAKKETHNLFSNLKNPSVANSLFFFETQTLKGDYSQIMENAFRSLLNQPVFINETQKSIRNGYKDWFDNFDTTAQNWFTHMFDVKNDFLVKKLPHVSAFLGYGITRIYERLVQGIKDRDNDFFDRDYFIDASVVDILVTNDERFLQTAKQVPNKRFKVMKLEELISLVDKRYTAEKGE